MNEPQNYTRRDMLGTSFAATAIASVFGIVQGGAAEDAPPAPKQYQRKIKLGVIGLGGRGSWISDLFLKHGGYQIHALADYFEGRVKVAGDRFGVDASRRFTGLSSYKKLIESGVEAVVIESPPYFHPEQAAAAVDAGLHVYCAKPVAVDVPGCRSIEASGKLATDKKLVFLVDFQTRADPFYIEAMRRIHAGDLGRIAFGEGIYHADCPWDEWTEVLRKQPNDPETRLKAWGLDKVLSGDIITEQNIHTLDVASWLMGVPPLHAVGSCGLTMRKKVGSCADHYTCHFQYPDHVGVTFSSRQSNGHGTLPDGIRFRAFGEKGVLETQYSGNVMIRGENFYRGGKSPGIYKDGAIANIDTFYSSVVEQKYLNSTVAPSVQSTLVTILGRTAAYSAELVTWDKLMATNEKWEADLKGLKS